jgi:hypothetical protein
MRRLALVREFIAILLEAQLEITHFWFMGRELFQNETGS